MRLSIRILFGMLLPIALLTAAGVYQLALIRSLHQENRALVGINLQARRLVLEIDSKLLIHERYTRVFLLLRDIDYVGELRRQREEINELMETVRRMELSSLELAQLHGVESAWAAYEELAERVETQVLERQPVSAPEILELHELRRTTRDELARLDAAILHTVENRLRVSGERVDRARDVSAAMAAASVALALVVAIFIARGLSRGLRRLAGGTREVAAGNFEFRVPTRGGAELRELGADFNWMAEHLGELDRLKRDFVSSVSHDLKAPLASMQETTRLLLEGTTGSLNDRQQRLLELNLQCNDRLSAMIVDLLDLARLEAGGLQFDRERTDLRELADLAVSELSALGVATDVEIELRFPDHPLWVDVDYRWITRAVWNLLSNAVRHSPADSRVDTAAALAGDRTELMRVCPQAPAELALPAVVLTVRDRGPGVDEDERQLIFDRFYRARSARRDGRGTGLGLAISREVVRRHGGDVWVEPAAGGGSLFAISLPAAEIAPPTHEHA